MSHLLSVSDAVYAHARLHPRRVATRDSARTLTFGQWDERATRLANGLLGLGLAKGDRIALLAYNCVEWMEMYVAVARAGLVAVPINFRLLGPEIAYIITHSEARAIIVQDDLHARSRRSARGCRSMAAATSTSAATRPPAGAATKR
jgi:acyl-CoA synthetase (AMP-forming)/AMP-acid ligase II